MISTGDVKPGMALELPDGLFHIVEYQHVKPGKGKAFVRMKLKNLRNGAVIDKTFRSDEDVPQAIIDRRDHQFLYRDDLGYHFMNLETYGQFALPDGDVGDAKHYLKEGSVVMLPLFEDYPIGVELPASVELAVTAAEPGVKGDRVSGATKPVTVETGLVVQAPLFVDVGDTIKVDTRTGSYMTRVVSDQVEPRQLALEAIYEADLRAVADPARGLKGKARRFVEGVVANQSDIDGRLDEVSDNWPVHRMAAVDRAILRLGAYELAYEQDTPKAVVISEAIELAKRFSTQKSGSFINGVLAALAREMRD